MTDRRRGRRLIWDGICRDIEWVGGIGMGIGMGGAFSEKGSWCNSSP